MLLNDGIILILESVRISLLLWILKVDLQEKRIPTKGVLFLGGVGLINLFFFFQGAPEEKLASALILPLLFGALSQGSNWILGRRALGKGDIKLAFPIGLDLSVSFLPLYLILTGTLGVAMGLIWYFLKRERDFPFAPSMILSLWGLKLFIE